MIPSQNKSPSKWLAIGHGAFFITSGLWPIVHMRSFEKVTGPKVDHWLVKTVGALLAVSGAVYLRAGLRQEKADSNIALLAAGQAATLGTVSLIYSTVGRISKIYLLDTAIEFSLVALWYRAQGTTFALSSRHAEQPKVRLVSGSNTATG